MFENAHEKRHLKNNLKSRRLRKLIFIISAGLLILILLGFHNYYTSLDIKRIVWTKGMLDRTKDDIEKFKKVTGRYPESISEMIRLSKEGQVAGIRKDFPKEYIFSKAGITKEYSVLNGDGGWYYDKDTEEVKVNVIKPVKHYLKLYFGKDRNEVPSDW